MLTDFGFAYLSSNIGVFKTVGDQANDWGSNHRWTAPELFLASEERREVGVVMRADVYSFGLTAYEVSRSRGLLINGR